MAAFTLTWFHHKFRKFITDSTGTAYSFDVGFTAWFHIAFTAEITAVKVSDLRFVRIKIITQETR